MVQSVIAERNMKNNINYQDINNTGTGLSLRVANDPKFDQLKTGTHR